MVVTGTFKDAEGNPFSGLSITFELDNFGSDMPRVQGSSVIVKFRLSATTDASGKISVILAGNDTITPSGTYYHVTVSGLRESTIERGYIFSGSTQDISNLTPEGAVPAAAPPVPAGFRLVTWSLKPAPVIVESVTVADDSYMFAHQKLKQLSAALTDPIWKPIVPQLLDHLAQVGVTLTDR